MRLKQHEQRVSVFNLWAAGIESKAPEQTHSELLLMTSC